MLRILLIILLFLNLRIKAAPISELVNPPPPLSTLATFTSTRSVYTIVWSCVVTTFLCSWVAIHPNVLPYDYERKRRPGCWDRAGQRLLLMLLTVIFPEAMIAMAWRERQTAKQVKKEFKKNGFDISMTHAYFIVMKGFALCLPEERVREIDAKAREGDEKAGSATTTNKTAKESKLLVDDDLGDARFFKTLTPEDFLERLNNSSIKLQIITKRDLQDRSKGDRMTKFITTVQALWFVVQCIVRCKEGLAITELELTTLALAILGALMMFLWRDKPQCVGVQIPVYLLKAEPEECEENERMLEAERLRKREEETLPRWRMFLRILRRNLGSLSLSLWGGIIEAFFDFLGFDAKHGEQEQHNTKPVMWLSFEVYGLLIQLIGLPFFLLSLVVTPIVFPFLIRFRGNESPFLPWLQRYFPTIPRRSDLYRYAMLVAFVGIVFGGLHCAAWNFSFPSKSVQWLWRITSLGLATLPYLFASCYLQKSIIHKELDKYLDDPFKTRLSNVQEGLASLFVLMGLLARICIIVLALILLRSQPATAYLATSWTKLFPHASS